MATAAAPPTGGLPPPPTGPPTAPPRPSPSAGAKDSPLPPFHYLLPTSFVFQTLTSAPTSKVIRPASGCSHPLASVHVATFASNDPSEDTHGWVLSPQSPHALLGVYDGHSGRRASAFARDHLFAFVAAGLEDGKTETGRHSGDGCKHNRVAAALAKGFRMADAAYLGDAAAGVGGLSAKDGLPGACLLAAYVAGRHVYVAGAGDARAVLGSVSPLPRAPQRMWDVPPAQISTSCNGVPVVEGSDVALGSSLVGPGKTKVVTPLSVDQHGTARDEVSRIRGQHPNEMDAIFRGRVKGRLQPTRGLGDGKYKQGVFNEAMSPSRRIPDPYFPPYTTVDPAVYHHKLTKDDAFMVLGCDGLWDMFSSEEVGEMVFEWMESPGPYTNCADYLIARVLDRAARPFILYTDTSTPIKALVSQPARKRRRMYDDTTVVVAFFDTDVVAQIVGDSKAGVGHVDVFGGVGLVDGKLRAEARAWAAKYLSPVV